jgi:LPXTG-motif cell wall-anchored protein
MDSLVAGEKVTYMTFIATGEPAGTSSGEMDTAFAEAVTEMAAFNELNDTLCRAIDDGTVIEGWGTCGAPAPDSELPDTGADTAVAGSLVSVASGLLIAGALALIVVRRRQTRS